LRLIESVARDRSVTSANYASWTSAKKGPSLEFDNARAARLVKSSA
jgi:hypothetical protein